MRVGSQGVRGFQRASRGGGRDCRLTTGWTQTIHARVLGMQPLPTVCATGTMLGRWPCGSSAGLRWPGGDLDGALYGLCVYLSLRAAGRSRLVLPTEVKAGKDPAPGGRGRPSPDGLRLGPQRLPLGVQTCQPRGHVGQLKKRLSSGVRSPHSWRKARTREIPSKKAPTGNIHCALHLPRTVLAAGSGGRCLQGVLAEAWGTRRKQPQRGPELLLEEPHKALPVPAAPSSAGTGPNPGPAPRPLLCLTTPRSGASAPCVTGILGAGKPLEIQEEGAGRGHGRLAGGGRDSGPRTPGHLLYPCARLSPHAACLRPEGDRGSHGQVARGALEGPRLATCCLSHSVALLTAHSPSTHGQTSKTTRPPGLQGCSCTGRRSLVPLSRDHTGPGPPGDLVEGSRLTSAGTGGAAESSEPRGGVCLGFNSMWMENFRCSSWI
ncbi:uncharacterized protein [Ovis canadensis]|uniref:uncharacterized protein n=1 Tax=Ovis canadensis TaxID=37174 RepID=UPI003752EB38